MRPSLGSGLMTRAPKRIELSVDDLRTPVTGGVAAPASKEPVALPFRSRTWPDFERILLQYAEYVDGLRSVRVYGVPGQPQHGIDLYGTDEAGRTVAYQAKNVRRFTAASLRAAVKQFIDKPPPELGVTHLIVCTACSTDNKRIGEELAKLRKANKSLTIELYDERSLSERLRGRPDLVRRLFGAEWQVAFCDNVPWQVPQPSPIDALADSLVRGPLVAHGLVDRLNQADALSETDPARAAELVGSVIDRVNDEGFPGSTATLRRQQADLLVRAGLLDEATAVLSVLAWAHRSYALVDEDPQAEGRLRALAKEHGLPAVAMFVDVIDAVDHWHQQPRSDLDHAIDLTLKLNSAGHPMATDLILWMVETAVAHRRVVRDGPLIDAVHGLIAARCSGGDSDEVTVRLRTAVADLGGDWAPVLRDARAGWLGARLATLVHARYGRYLHLHGQPVDAQAEFSAAVRVACQAQLGNEAADALYSITNTRARYGPLDSDLNVLPRMAIDLRSQGHTLPLLSGRDPADAGAEALAGGRHPQAFWNYKAAIRHCVIRGDAAGEESAHRHVADILLRSGEPAAAVRHIIWCGSDRLLKKQLTVPVYIDLQAEVLDGAHWERATALEIVAKQSDLVPDAHVAHYFAVAWAGIAEPQRSVFGPHVDLGSWKVIAAFADRLPEPDAVKVLHRLDQFIAREPGTYHFIDDDHVGAVARIHDAHPSLTARCAEHLRQLVLQDYNLGETVRRAVRQFVDDPRILLDALRPHAGMHPAAANILSDHGEYSKASLTRVAKRIKARLNPPPAPPQPPGQVSYGIGTDVPELAQQARGLPVKTQRLFIEYCMALAENEAEPAPNRADGMEGVALLARFVDDSTRDALFERTMPLARLDLPPTKVDQMLRSTHPLSPFQVNLGNGALPGRALQALARLAHTREQAQAVQHRVVAWLTGDEQAINAVAHTLDQLDPAHITIDLTALAAHPSQWLRQVVAIKAARATPPAEAVLRALAADPDRQVRRIVGQLISRIAVGNRKLAAELRQQLKSDVSWMVRRAAATDVPWASTR